MKITLQVTDGPPMGYTTVGFWRFEKPNNQGPLHLYVARLPDRRFFLSVLGHEFIEVMYCWMRGITTEQCDKFDDWMELEYSSGRIPKTFEGGFHKDCPYRIGHVMGSWWEWAFIHGTFASWKSYDKACNIVMKIQE